VDVTVKSQKQSLPVQVLLMLHGSEHGQHPKGVRSVRINPPPSIKLDV
jgi:hypothetical protein